MVPAEIDVHPRAVKEAPHWRHWTDLPTGTPRSDFSALPQWGHTTLVARAMMVTPSDRGTARCLGIAAAGYNTKIGRAGSRDRGKG